MSGTNGLKQDTSSSSSSRLSEWAGQPVSYTCSGRRIHDNSFGIIRAKSDVPFVSSAKQACLFCSSSICLEFPNNISVGFLCKKKKKKQVASKNNYKTGSGSCDDDSTFSSDYHGVAASCARGHASLTHEPTSVIGREIEFS